MAVRGFRDHDCKRFKRLGGCPFAVNDKERFGVPDHKGPHLVPPAKKAKENTRLGQLTQLFTEAVSKPEARAALERVAAIQVGGAPSVIEPNVGSLLLEHGPQGIMAALTALAMDALSSKQGLLRTLSRSQAVRITEQQVARRLSQLSARFGLTGSGPSLQPSGGGRGGFAVNDAERIAEITGMRFRPRSGTGAFVSTFPQDYF